MKERIYIVFGIVSFLVLIAAVCYAIKVYKEKDKGKRVLSSLHFLTLGVFISTVFIFIPVYYAGYDFGDSSAWIRPFLISIHHAFRVFILDGEFDIIRDSVSRFGKWPHILFSLYASVLFVIAPILTLRNVLSLFKNIINEFRFSLYKKRSFYIFSELNERSITLAESIVSDSNIKNPVVVFTDVFERDEEDHYELLLRAHDLNAVLLKKDITRLNVRRKKSTVEFFLIGENESENIDQAIKLTMSNKDCVRRAIYVFSSKQSSGYILDSLDKGNRIISESLEKRIVENAKEVLYENNLSSEDFCFEDSFYLRRINSVESLSTSVLSKSEIIGPISKAIAQNAIGQKRISLMIVGFGEYGKAFLKTALWLYQHFGCSVEITVLDKEDKNVIAGKLHKECPDLRIGENVSVPGDSNYHIRIVPFIDVDISGLEELFNSEENTKWIKTIQMVLVSLGDDDKNIETAVSLRKLFDCLNDVDNKSKCFKDIDELPLIYSIVYNEKKASNLTSVSDHRGNLNQEGLKDYRGHSYHIHFIGSLNEQYSYRVIEELKKTEREALKYHLEWVSQTSRLRDAYVNPKYDDNNTIKDYREKAHQYFKEESAKKARDKGEKCIYTETWDDEFMFGKTKEGKIDYSEIKVDEVIKMILDYMDYEYYRNSSISKAMYQAVYQEFCKFQSADETFIETEEHDSTSALCMCKSCLNKRISEHKRWNAYMRTIGYKTGTRRADRGQIHPNLIPWNDLPFFDRYKD